MNSRFGMRLAQQFARQTQQTGFRTEMRNPVFRRWQTNASNPAVDAPPPQSFFQRLWTSEVGIKTVHFWAPIMKWGVVIAGASDFLRPAEKLSLTQNLALMATGSIWTRWCFVIRPQNMLLAAVNFCLFLVGTTQVSRILIYRQSQTGSTEQALESAKDDVVAGIKAAEKKVEKLA